MEKRKMVSIIIFILYFVGLFTLFFFLGWLSNDLYEYYDYHRKIDGFYIKNVTEQQVDDMKESKDKYGDWVCVNVRDMKFERAMEVCSHEVGHEIFAEYCEEKPSRCLRMVQNEE